MDNHERIPEMVHEFEDYLIEEECKSFLLPYGLSVQRFPFDGQHTVFCICEAGKDAESLPEVGIGFERRALADFCFRARCGRIDFDHIFNKGRNSVGTR